MNADPIQPGNMRVLQLGEHLCLANKVRPEICLKADIAEELDRNAPAYRAVFGEINFTHPASTEGPQEVVRPKVLKRYCLGEHVERPVGKIKNVAVEYRYAIHVMLLQAWLDYPA